MNRKRIVRSSPWKLVGRDVLAIGRGTISVMVGILAGALASGGQINWRSILTAGGATLLSNIGQRLGGESTFQVPVPDTDEDIYDPTADTYETLK